MQQLSGCEALFSVSTEATGHVLSRSLVGAYARPKVYTRGGWAGKKGEHKERRLSALV